MCWSKEHIEKQIILKRIWSDRQRWFIGTWHKKLYNVAFLWKTVVFILYSSIFQTKTLRSQRLYYQQQKTVRKLRLKSQSFAFIKTSLKDSIQGCGDILSVTFSEQKFKPYFAASCIPLLLLSFWGWRQFANSSQELWSSDFHRHQPLTWAISDVNVFEDDQII